MAASLLPLARIPPPPQVAFVPANPILFSKIQPDVGKEETAAEDTKKKGMEEEEEEDEGGEAFKLPPSTAPAILSRGGRKRAPTMKTLESEMAPKRGTGQGRAGKGRGRGRSRARGRDRGCRRAGSYYPVK